METLSLNVIKQWFFYFNIKLLEIFNQLAAIKDIRTVIDKNTKQFKDFVFIEFYSVEEAELVLRAC